MASIRIYNDIKGIPHTFIGITDDNGNTIYRGFSPEKTGLLGVSSVKDEATNNKLHEFTTSSYEIQISNEQYQKAIDFIEYSQNNPPVYNLPADAQCTIWVLEVLEKGGIISLPHYMPKGIEAAIPGQFFIGILQSIAYNPYTFAFGDAVNIGFDIVAQAINDGLKEFSEFLNEITKHAIKTIINPDEILPAAQQTFNNKTYIDFLNTIKYFNEDGTMNFAQFLADTANISLYDPIALDLNNNGKIDTLSLENGVFFDHNGDEIAFKSSWISGDDGILARDINGDKEINSGAELFGNFTKLKNGELAKNGAEALSDLDDNNDGLFDESDKAFNEILVWQDENSNGKAESSELKSLSEHGIKSINLEFLDDNTALDKDNKQILVGSFAINDSDNALASDIDFSVNTIEREMAESAGLVKGTGFVRDFKPNLSKEIEGFYTKYKELDNPKISA